MSSRIIIDTENSKTTSRKVESFPWIRFDANKFIYEEAFIEGNYVGLHFSAMGRANTRERIYDKYKLSNKQFYKNHFSSFELEVDGQLLKDYWNLVEIQQNKTSEGYDEFVIILSHDLKCVNVRVHTLLDGSSFIERWLDIVNMGTESFSISSIFPWCGIVFNEDDISITSHEEYKFELGRYKNMNWSMEGEFIWDTLNEGTFKVESNKINKFGPNFYVVKNVDTAEMLVIDFEYTGGICVEFSNCNYKSDRFRLPWRGNYLYTKVGLAGNSPYYVLNPGESVSTPAVHISMLYGNLDVCTNELFAHLRKSVIPKPLHPINNPVEFNYAGYSLCVPTTEQMILKEIDMAAEIGAELFIVDAGWWMIHSIRMLLARTARV
jgi:alpha-galactosidase